MKSQEIKKMKTKIIQLTLLVSLFVVSIISQPVFSQSHAGRGAAKGAGTGAMIGALAGVVLGDGDVLGDAIGGAAIGAGAGAIGGAIHGGNRDRREREEMQQLIAEYGEDNLRGYVELVNGNHERAIALFRVEQASSDMNHRLIGLWLEASAEKDRRNSLRTEELCEQLVMNDPDIDDLDMANVAVTQLVLDIRNDRRSHNF